MGVRIPQHIEAACVRPGTWRVEGLDVEKWCSGGSWRVTLRRPGEPDAFLGKRRTLTAAISEVVAPYLDQRTHCG
ncbi:hypothetical protein [Mycobacterium phage Kashi_VT1]|nr:hypothetical protein [Mycobacterium phage Kashi_VT1]